MDNIPALQPLCNIGFSASDAWQTHERIIRVTYKHCAIQNMKWHIATGALHCSYGWKYTNEYRIHLKVYVGSIFPCPVPFFVRQWHYHNKQPRPQGLLGIQILAQRRCSANSRSVFQKCSTLWLAHLWMPDLLFARIFPPRYFEHWEDPGDEVAKLINSCTSSCMVL